MNPIIWMAGPLVRGPKEGQKGTNSRRDVVPGLVFFGFVAFGFFVCVFCVWGLFSFEDTENMRIFAGELLLASLGFPALVEKRRIL